MTLLAWTNELSMGLPEIDRQHKKLIGMINQLDDETRAGTGTDAISGILDELIIYSATHFRMEEKYFDQFGYADSEVHKQEHAALAEKVDQFSAELNSADEDRRRAVIAELMSFLSIWWKYHILETDMKYAKLFREKGVK
jgi:hemerythrin